jgi:hypothetical protein
MKTVEIPFHGLRRTETGKKVLYRLFCGGYGSDRPGTNEAYGAYKEYVKYGKCQVKHLKNKNEAYSIWKRLPANARATLNAAYETTTGDLDHIRSYKNISEEGHKIHHRSSDNMAGFGDPSLNRSRGSRDMHPKEVEGVKARQRAVAYQAVAKEHGKRYANKINEDAKQQIKLKQESKEIVANALKERYAKKAKIKTREDELQEVINTSVKRAKQNKKQNIQKQEIKEVKPTKKSQKKSWLDHVGDFLCSGEIITREGNATYDSDNRIYHSSIYNRSWEVESYEEDHETWYSINDGKDTNCPPELWNDPDEIFSIDQFCNDVVDEIKSWF